MNEFMQYWSISSIIITEEAEKLWLKVDIISKNKNTFIVKWKWKEILFKSTDFWWNSSLWHKITNDKELTYKILDKEGFPIAKSYYIAKEEIKNFQEWKISHLNFPLIIKPVDEWHGNWVMMNILSYEELYKKLSSSFDIYDNMIIQEEIQWDEIRVVVVKWKVILARNRVAASIIWDGISTIQSLIANENENNPYRWEWYTQPLAYIEIDRELLSFIEKQNISLNTIPLIGEKIQLRWNSNTWTWWTMIDVTDILSDEIKKTCIDAVKIFGLDICGIDILTKDLTTSLDVSQWVILELNPTPGIGWERELTNVNTWREILKILFSI